ncbi:rhomboid family intramembrane serine protease [Salsuginibacillus kocurii]|uniref:rhomboid family intramembrane serine protease n=1 Tax=Salsuginibacillus kocurii TaxID=427078 RepID=UPI00037D850D|nr:rhomboid family intramembrane serine protease [Salsuginibacillus kocurii]
MMFLRNESFYTFRRDYPIITTLVAIHLLIFLLMNLSRFIPFFPLGDLIYEYGIGLNFLIYAENQYWRLVTPIFMHINTGHVLFNSFALVLFGPALERMLGKFKFIFFYLATGILANIATYYLGGLDYAPHLGASGAIYGLLGLYLYMVMYRRDLIDQASSQMIVIILAIGMIMTFITPNINIFAHLFGAIAGAALGPLILRKATPVYMEVRQRPDEDAEPTFDPNRWNKRRSRIRINRSTAMNVLGLAFIILVIIGVISNFL